LKNFAGIPFFLQKERNVQKGGRAPPFLGKRGLPPIFFERLPPKLLTEFSFGIGMVNTEKYRPIPTEKYRFGIQLYLKQLNCYGLS
jgi:hypothetical protein